MDPLLDDIVSPDDLKKFAAIYNSESQRGCPSETTTFDFALCLVRSRSKADIEWGITLLEGLFKSAKDETAKRDFLYFVAIGHTKLKNYTKALEFTNAILEVQPRNVQAKNLQVHINKQMKKEGLIGMAIVGGAAAVAIGGIAAILGVALSKR